MIVCIHQSLPEPLVPTGITTHLVEQDNMALLARLIRGNGQVVDAYQLHVGVLHQPACTIRRQRCVAGVKGCLEHEAPAGIRWQASALARCSAACAAGTFADMMPAVLASKTAARWT